MVNEQLISVIIPTYNRAASIKDSIDSVLDQTYSNLEIIVIDDASTDNTEEIVKSIKDNRIIYYKLPENGKVAHARNIGVSMSSSDIIVFHDSDDLCMPDRIEKQYSYLAEHPEYDLVYSALRVTKGNQSIIFPPGNYNEKLEGDIHKELLLCNTIDCPAIMMRKSVFCETNGFNETYPNLSDWEFVIRVSENHLIGYINEPLIISILLDTGISADRSKFYMTRARMIVEKKAEFDRDNIFTYAIQRFFNDADSEGLLELAKLSIQKELLKSM